MSKTTPDPGIAKMRALTLRSRLADAEADPLALMAQADARSVGAFVTIEQALWRYRPATPLAAIYPPDGLLEADYPLVLADRVTADAGRRALAASLVERMRDSRFAATLAAHGFRAANASLTPSPPTAEGILPMYPQPTAIPREPSQVFDPASQWSRYKRLTYQVLILVDGSGSMNEQVRDSTGRVTTKAELLRASGSQAAQLFGLDTSVALWLFATPTPGAPPYTEVIPFGPLDEPLGPASRREVLRQTAGAYKAYEKAGTPLYETVLRATGAMRQRVKPGTVTLVVVLTDGRDEDSPYSMAHDVFMGRLAAARDPARPVPVFAIGYGAGADFAALQDMARVTGGAAIPSNQPGDLASAMARVFLAAHAVD